MKKDLTGTDIVHEDVSVAPKLMDRYKQLKTAVAAQERAKGQIEKKDAEIKGLSKDISDKKKDIKELKAQIKNLEKELKKSENDCAKLSNKLVTLKAAKDSLKEKMAEFVDIQKDAMVDIAKATKDKTVKSALETYEEILTSKKKVEVKEVEKVEKPVEEVKKPVEEVKKQVEEVKKPVEEVKKATTKRKTSKKKEDTKIVTPPTVKPEVVVDDKTVNLETAEIVAVEGKKKIEIVYSFDTTGSMYSVLALVRKHIAESIKQMFSLDCELRVGVLAHGDYCDKDKPYTIMFKDLTDDEESLQSFVKDIEPTYGGDMDECYELVLKTINDLTSWSDDSTKMLVLIGDANPHEPSYRLNTDKIDWRKEAQKLADKNINVYAVHALSNYRRSSKNFYETVASITNGIYLTLDNFSDVNDLMIASLYQRYSEEKLDQYVTVIRDKGRLTRTLADNVNRLAKKQIVTNKFDSIKGLNIVPAGRFQVIPVDEKCDIKGFVQNNGIMYKVGRAFYELTKTEDVQQYKEVILQDKESGDMYFGEDTRKYLGLLPQVERSGKYAHEKIKPIKGDRYRVFVQSTSVNRKLVPGTNLLYEISESESR